MSSLFRPIIVLPVLPMENGNIRALDEDKNIDIVTSDSESIWKILRLCDGFHSFSSISAETGYSDLIIESVLNRLRQLKIIADCTEQYRSFHLTSNYPSHFTPVLEEEELVSHYNSGKEPTKVGTIIPLHGFDSPCFANNGVKDLYSCIYQRVSCRQMDCNKLISLDEISRLCFYAYSLQIHSVPSGGGLYPLKVFLLVEKDQIGFSKGYYEYDSIKNELILFNSDVDIDSLCYCFNTPSLPFGSSIQIVIAADISRQPYKYGNRGYRLTLLDAGHVAQNIALVCTENGLASCELGGVLDEPLRKEIAIDNSDIYPLVSIAIGVENPRALKKQIKTGLAELLSGNSPIIACEANYYNGCEFFCAWAEYQGGLAGATDTSYQFAKIKAAIEGYERFLSSRIRCDLIECAANLEGMWVDPRLYIPLSKDQLNSSGLLPFNENLSIKWVIGRYLANNIDVYVPTDMVFYGQAKSEMIYSANSSGVAAFTRRDEAIKRAIVELIERDCVMRLWFGSANYSTIDILTMPLHIRKRYSYWKSRNCELTILSIDSAYANSFLSIIHSDIFPFFSCGAAATVDGNIELACKKALAEAEYSFFSAASNKSVLCDDAQNVHRPHDHAEFYNQGSNLRYISWLWEEQNVISFSSIPIKHNIYETIAKELDIVVVDIGQVEFSSETLFVVRALSSKLVPISFGLNLLHYLHDYSNIAPNRKQIVKTIPHYFA